MCKIFPILSLQKKCAGNAVLCDTIAVSAVHWSQVSICPSNKPNDFDGHVHNHRVCSTAGLSIQMVLFLPDCLSGHRRTAARGHMFYYSGQLWLKPRSLASHRLCSNTKSWLWKHQVWVDTVLLEECEVSVCTWCVFPSASNSVREWTCPCDRRHTIKLNLNALPAKGKHFRA